MIKKSVNLTAEGKKELEKELEELIASRPEIAEKIATARAFGDLSENEEYSSARNEQKLTESRILEIQELLKNAKIIRGGLGGKEVEYTLVGPTEANPLEGKISNESPIGKAISGHKAGDSVEFNGKKVEIIEIK